MRSASNCASRSGRRLPSGETDARGTTRAACRLRTGVPAAAPPRRGRPRILRALPSVAFLWLGLLVLLSAGDAGASHASLLKRREARIRRLGPIVTEILFVGNDTFEAERLLTYMETVESGFFRTTYFDRRILSRDLDKLEMLYQMQGFLDAEVNAEDFRLGPDSLSVEILVGVYEGDRWSIDEVTIEGNDVVTDAELTEVFRLEPGGPFFQNSVERDRRAILDEYARRSYLDARVFTSVDRDDVVRTATVHHGVIEREQARIGEIAVLGDDKTRQYVIEREFEFKPGELFDFEKIGETQANVYRTGLFNSVWIEPAAEDTGKVVKDLVVRVNERPSGVFEFTVGYAAFDGLEVGAEISNRNVQGQAIRLGIEGRHSRLAREVRLSLGDPYFTGRRIAVNTETHYGWSDEGSHVAETAGGSLILSKGFGSTVTVEGGYEFERTIVLESVDGSEDIGANYTSDVPLATTYDTRDDILDTRRGMLARIEVDVASSRLGGTNDFVRTTLIWRGFQRLTHGRVAGLATRFGWVKSHGDGSEVPVNERFLAGGEGSVRGFERNSLGPVGEDGKARGGRALLEVRGEIRFPVWKKIRMAAFVDAGQVFEDWRATTFTNLAVGGGLGLRYVSPFGILRFDAAIPVTGNGHVWYYVSIGQAF